MNLEELTSWDVITWIVGALGLGALVAAYFSETVRQLLPTPRRLARWLKRGSLAPSAGKHFTVLVADLKRDADGSQTDHVAAALAPYRGIDVVRIGSGPEWDFGSRTRLEAQAQRLLDDKGGDVLIFGEVRPTSGCASTSSAVMRARRANTARTRLRRPSSPRTSAPISTPSF